MGVWWDFVFDNSYQVDCEEAEKKAREKYPLLLHENEKIEFAFKDRGGRGRDKEYFTSHRILIKDGKGIGSKRKNYYSVPYDTIQAFSCETAGKFDGDVELKVWCRANRKISIDFATAEVDIFQIQQFLNCKVKWSYGVGKHDLIDSTPPNMDQKQSTLGNAMDWLGDNASQIDASVVEAQLKSETPVLCKDEKVEIAFKSGRDTTLFTDRRVMIIDVQGITGKKIEFKSVLWSTIHAYEVETAGFLDRDTEVRLYTNMVHWESISQDLRNGKANLFELQKVLCNHILGEDKDPLPEVDRREGQEDPKGNWWFRDNQRPLDAVEMDQVYHTSPQILQGGETVEFAFKGRRDVTMFTTKRLIIIDPKGITGKSISYKSIPWKSLMAFGIRTAGKWFDWDTEVLFYTEMCFFPGSAGSPATDDSEEVPPVPAEPLMSAFELELNKNYVDMYKLKYYLSKRILQLDKMEVGAPIPLDALTTEETNSGMFDTILGFIGDDQTEIDARALDRELHTTSQILLDNESCIMAFKAGRDISIFTNLRIMLLDVQGLSGQKIEYTSIPLKTIRSFSVETAGTFDTDTELQIITRNRWHLANVKMDFRSGKADIIQINRFLSALIVGHPSDPEVRFDPKSYQSHGETNAIGIDSLISSIFDGGKEIDAAEIETKFKTSPNLLLEEEKVIRAFKEGRDLTVFTDRRKIHIDTKGLTGQRVKYTTIPYKWTMGYEFETAGHLDWDAELYMYTDVAHVFQYDEPRICYPDRAKTSVLTESTNIYELGNMMNDYILFDKYKDEPEIEVPFFNYDEPEFAVTT